jgi:hypothetical protein
LAKAHHVYAIAKKNFEAVQVAKGAELWAERRAGEMLREQIPHEGDRPKLSVDTTVSPSWKIRGKFPPPLKIRQNQLKLVIEPCKIKHPIDT